MEIVPKEDAKGAFKGQQLPIIQLIGKLCKHVQGYVHHEDFYVSLLQHADILLGAPSFTHMLATLQYPNRVIMFEHRLAI